MRIAVWLALALIWGTTWLVLKVGLSHLPPFTFAGIRFLLAGLVLLAVVVVRRLPPPRTRADWSLIGVTGLLQIALSYGFTFWGQQHISSGLAAVFLATVPLFVLVLADFMLQHERVTGLKLLGVFVGLAGVALIFSNQMQLGSGRAVQGSAALLVAAILMAIAQVILKKGAGRVHAMVLASGQMLLGCIPLLIIGVRYEGWPWAIEWNAVALGSLLYLTLIGSSLAFFLFYWLLERMAVTKVTMMMFVHPVVAVALGWLVLDETLGWRAAAGVGAIMMALTMVLAPRLDGSIVRRVWSAMRRERSTRDPRVVTGEWPVA